MTDDCCRLHSLSDLVSCCGVARAWRAAAASELPWRGLYLAAFGAPHDWEAARSFRGQCARRAGLRHPVSATPRTAAVTAGGAAAGDGGAPAGAAADRSDAGAVSAAWLSPGRRSIWRVWRSCCPPSCAPQGGFCTCLRGWEAAASQSGTWPAAAAAAAPSSPPAPHWLVVDAHPGRLLAAAADGPLALSCCDGGRLVFWCGRRRERLGEADVSALTSLPVVPAFPQPAARLGSGGHQLLLAVWAASGLAAALLTSPLAPDVHVFRAVGGASTSHQQRQLQRWPPRAPDGGRQVLWCGRRRERLGATALLTSPLAPDAHVSRAATGDGSRCVGQRLAVLSGGGSPGDGLALFRGQLITTSVLSSDVMGVPGRPAVTGLGLARPHRHQVNPEANAQLSAADISRLKALYFLEMGRCTTNRNGVILNLEFRIAFLEDPANGFCSSLADELVQLAKEHVRLLRQEAPEAELQLLAMVVEAVWSALMGAMKAKGFADKLHGPDMRERDTEDLRQLVTRARELVPLLSTPAVLGRFTAPALAALLGRPEGEPLPERMPAFDVVNGWTAVVGLLLGHFSSVRELACAVMIIDRLPENFRPSAIADDLARRRPVPDFDGMRAFVVSRLEEADAEAETLDSVSDDFTAVEEPLQQLRRQLCTDGAFADGAGLAAHLRRQLNRRVDLRGQEVYSGGCCALETLRHMAEVEEREETQAMQTLACPDTGLGGYMRGSCTLGRLWLAGIDSLTFAMQRTASAMERSQGVQGTRAAAAPLRCLRHGMAVVTLTPAFMNCAAHVVVHLLRVDRSARRILENAQQADMERRPIELPTPDTPLRVDAPAPHKRRRNEAGGDGGDGDAGMAADAAPPAEVTDADGDDFDDDTAAGQAPKVADPVDAGNPSIPLHPPVQQPAAHAEAAGAATGAAAQATAAAAAATGAESRLPAAP